MIISQADYLEWKRIPPEEVETWYNLALALPENAARIGGRIATLYSGEDVYVK